MIEFENSLEQMGPQAQNYRAINYVLIAQEKVIPAGRNYDPLFGSPTVRTCMKA